MVKLASRNFPQMKLKTRKHMDKNNNNNKSKIEKKHHRYSVSWDINSMFSLYTAESYELDPICQFNFAGSLEDIKVTRLCAIILQSASFKKKVKYPVPDIINRCYLMEVSLRSKEAIEKANKNYYFERMVLCRAPLRDSEEKEYFYISRAYNPNEVFVYTADPRNGRIYLKNLSINVSIVHERYNFGNIEI